MLKKLFILMMAMGLIVLQSCGGDDPVSCSGTVDCAGVCDGTAVEDACGVCGGDGSDCAGTCASNVFDGDGACCDSGTLDCNSVCDGPAVVDGNGECCDSGTVDCAGACDGTAVEDCADECGGTAAIDNCGTCDVDTSNDCDLCDVLPDNSMYISPTGQLWYNSTDAIGGFQFTLQGSSFNSDDFTIIGSDVPVGLTPTIGVSSGIVLGISLTGESIPAGCGAGYQFDIADPSAITGIGGQNVFIVSSTTGTALTFTYYTGN